MLSLPLPHPPTAQPQSCPECKITRPPHCIVLNVYLVGTSSSPPQELLALVTRAGVAGDQYAEIWAHPSRQPRRRKWKCLRAAHYGVQVCYSCESAKPKFPRPPAAFHNQGPVPRKKCRSRGGTGTARGPARARGKSLSCRGLIGFPARLTREVAASL